jgi:hypothetical protein
MLVKAKGRDGGNDSFQANRGGRDEFLQVEQVGRYEH